MEVRKNELRENIRILKNELDLVSVELDKKDDQLAFLANEFFRSLASYKFLKVFYDYTYTLTDRQRDRIEIEVSLDEKFEYENSYTFNIYVYKNEIKFSNGSIGTTTINSAYFKALECLVRIMNQQEKIRMFVNDLTAHRQVYNRMRDLYDSIEYFENELTGIERKEQEEKALAQLILGAVFELDNIVFKISRITEKMVYYNKIIKNYEGIETLQDYEERIKKELLVNYIIYNHAKKRGDE